MGAWTRRIFAILIIWAVLAQMIDFFRFGILTPPIPESLVFILGILMIILSKDHFPGTASATRNWKTTILGGALVLISTIQLIEFFAIAKTPEFIENIPDSIIKTINLFLAIILLLIGTPKGEQRVSM